MTSVNYAKPAQFTARSRTIQSNLSRIIRPEAHYRQRAGSIVHSLSEPKEFHYLEVLDPFEVARWRNLIAGILLR